MDAWFVGPDYQKRLGHPFAAPGGPVAVAGAAVSKRQRVSEFQEQAAGALTELAAQVQQGILERVGPELAAAPQVLYAGVDASDLRMPYCPGALTHGVLLPPLMANGTAAAGHNTANHHHQQQQASAAASLPASCLLLESWREAAAAGVVAPAASAATAARGAAAAGTAAGAAGSGVLQPGSEVVVTLVVYEAGAENSKVVMQEVQALGSNTLSELRDIITCPLDRLAHGLAAHNPAAYFFLDNTFYDDTRSAPQSECSQLLQQWAAAAGLVRPRALHYASMEEEEQQLLLLGGAGVQPAAAGAVDDEQQQQQLVQQQQQDGQQQQGQQLVQQQQQDGQQQQGQQQQQPVAGQQGHWAPPLQQQQHQQRTESQQQPHCTAGQQAEQEPNLDLEQQFDMQIEQQHLQARMGQQQQEQQQQVQQPPEREQQPLPQQPPPPQQQHQQQQQSARQQQQQQPAATAATIAAAQQQQAGAHAMQDTRISDLHLQVSNRVMGLYSHQGCCEHSVMVADVRLLHAADPRMRCQYPRTLLRAPLHKRFNCNICRRQGALVLLMNHPETPEQVVMLCARCEGLFDAARYPQCRKVVLGEVAS